MLIKTKHFGEVEIDEDKIIEFNNGILGFEDCRLYTLLFDNEKGDRADVFWLQSLDEPTLAIPVMSPFLLMADYIPEIEDELLQPLGELTDENIIILVSLTVPSDITQISMNLKAPFIINSDTRRGSQVVVENPDYEVKYYCYDKLQEYKAAKGGV